MIAVEFTQDIIEELRTERFNHPSPKVQLKMEALYLKSKGLKHFQICDICDITNATLASYLKIYAEKGIHGLRAINYKGKRNLLLEECNSIEEYFVKYPPRTLKEAKAKIYELIGVDRSLTQIFYFFRKIKLKRRKVKAVPGKALLPGKQQEQADFVAEELEPRLKEAENGEREIFLWMPHTLSIKHF